MKIVKTQLLVLVAILCLSSALEDGPWHELLRLDCKGRLTLLPSGPFTSTLDLHKQWRFQNSAYDALWDRVQCKAEALDDELQGRGGCQFDETDFKSRMTAGPKGLIQPFREKHMRRHRNTCGHPDRNVSIAPLFDLERFPFLLPESCDYDEIMLGGDCLMELDFEEFKLQFALRFAIAANNSECRKSFLPYISITCSGAFCDHLLHPCINDLDCESELFMCQDLPFQPNTLDDTQGLFDAIVELGFNIFNDEEYNDVEVCFEHFTLDIWNLLLQALKREQTDSVPDKFALCLPVNLEVDFGEWLGDKVHCTMDDNLINCNESLIAWDGILDSGDYAATVERKASSDFLDDPDWMCTMDGMVPFELTCEGDYKIVSSADIFYGGSISQPDGPALIHRASEIYLEMMKCRVLQLEGVTLSYDALKTRFLPSMEMLLWLFDHHNASSYLLENGIVDLGPDSINDPVMLIAEGLNLPFRINMPEKCSYEYYIQNNLCELSWNSLSDVINETSLVLTIRGCDECPLCDDSDWICEEPLQLPNIFVWVTGELAGGMGNITICNDENPCIDGMTCMALQFDNDFIGGMLHRCSSSLTSDFIFSNEIERDIQQPPECYGSARLSREISIVISGGEHEWDTVGVCLAATLHPDHFEETMEGWLSDNIVMEEVDLSTTVPVSRQDPIVVVQIKGLVSGNGCPFACSEHGICDESGTQPICECDTGWEGDYCEIELGGNEGFAQGFTLKTAWAVALILSLCLLF